MRSFTKGWTLWCEQMMVDLRIDRSPWLPVQQLHDALWRCHRILVDLRLQTGRYSYEQAVGHLQRHVGFTRARAEADVNWYTAQPAVPMSYWLGRLENERLRQRLMTGRGWSLRKFNDWLLSFGTIPQAWIEKYTAWTKRLNCSFQRPCLGYLPLMDLLPFDALPAHKPRRFVPQAIDLGDWGQIAPLFDQLEARAGKRAPPPPNWNVGCWIGASSTPPSTRSPPSATSP
jgi:hypothetical protein